MDTHTKRWEPLTGILFGTLLMAGGLLASTGLPYGASAGEVASFFEDAAARVSAGGALVMLSAAPLLWFVACLRRRLEADGDGGPLPGIVATAGGACAAVVLVAAASLLGTASRIGFPGRIEPAIAAVSWDLFGNLLGTALAVAMAVLVTATVIAARRSGWFAPPAAWLSWLLVAGLLALPVSWMFAAAALLWVAAVGISMTARHPSRAGVAATPTHTA